MAKGPLVFMVPVLNSWMAVDRGEDPIAGLDVHAGGALLRRYGTEHRALLLLATGQTAQGMTALDAILESSGEDGDDLRIDAAELLQGMGKRKEAKALLAQTRVGLSVSRGGIGRGAKPGAAFGASRLFLGLAVDLAQQDLVDLSIALTRAALLIDPSEDRARLYLAEALSRAGSDRIAIDVLAQVPRGSPFARGAAAGRVAALRRAGRMAEAIAGAKAMAEDRDSLASDAQNYGDLLMADAQYDAAAAAYAVALKRAGGDGGWGLHFLRGSALDRAGKWDEALPELHRAVELAPNEAAAVTYLGYALVEHRGDLSEAQGLLERAKRLKPGDAGITDSLAWTYYLRGDTARALPMLEEAARADPGGALVNEHLGDVYWKLGRRYEARYAWRAAAIYAAEADGARIEAKLRDGLTASN
jgi:tetratricopeptide (TPR) repeat protein